ncbi:tRNA1(Val) (adenine(37)-N6)-methyltransferase [Otariodibacter oris]|uniref:tRNA1(Val) (adenine(37)-N6)-methyltransferase n=1 Tax=Otariodibacter oris TaxID=1032623 RepID=A0A420XGP8_9PAST|nr:methyltransferase [Otariodibacter oris]QGM80118.1 tRNA (adenosine(37)-N6)-methyltransferase TrmM [Otariodibacter oris]RKR71946.1 tRNA1Val (adenine37-N6)-methyltransferase [Otariodibacter oris]
MASKGFQFKQFFIAHDQCAMKVNTDSILLGAIAEINNVHSILDMGTGSGLLAIMLAQRTACVELFPSITAIELEQDAYSQATDNSKLTPWHNRISIIHGDVTQIEFTQQFDLIVSNPPYFSDSLPSKTKARGLARNITQNHITWLSQAKKWLSSKGRITFILPLDAGLKLIEQAKEIGLYCIERYTIQSTPNKLAKRIILTFSRVDKVCADKQLVIYQENHQYSEEFKELTQDFYVNF